MHKFEAKYTNGDMVYVKTDLDQYERMITGVHFRPHGINYSVSFGDHETAHFEIELSSKKDTNKGLFAN